MAPSGSKWQKRQAIAYTPRDIQVLYALWGIKYMTTTQIWALFWRETSQNKLLALKSCQRRLRQLERYGVIRRLKQAVKRGEGSRPDIFKLAAKSVPLLAYECGVDPKAVDVEVWADEESSPKIKHILATTDVRIAFHMACHTSGYTVAEWSDESALRNAPTKDTLTLTDAKGDKHQIVIIPDALFILKRGEKSAVCRLEVDRATMELEASREQKHSIAQKLRRYLLLEESPSYREHYGTRPLLVLWAVKGERRMNNLYSLADKVIKEKVKLPKKMPTTAQEIQAYQEKQAQVEQLSQRFLFTTLEQIARHNVLTDEIWRMVGRQTPKAFLDDLPPN